jgi:hypothetical protein
MFDETVHREVDVHKRFTSVCGSVDCISRTSLELADVSTRTRSSGALQVGERHDRGP